MTFNSTPSSRLASQHFPFHPAEGQVALPRELREARGRAGVGAGVVFSPTEAHRLGGVLLASPGA